MSERWRELVRAPLRRVAAYHVPSYPNAVKLDANDRVEVDRLVQDGPGSQGLAFLHRRIAHVRLPKDDEMPGALEGVGQDRAPGVAQRELA